jgi:hypothetical protein
MRALIVHRRKFARLSRSQLVGLLPGYWNAPGVVPQVTEGKGKSLRFEGFGSVRKYLFPCAFGVKSAELVFWVWAGSQKYGSLPFLVRRCPAGAGSPQSQQAETGT